jgi:hypothetical protein
VRSIPWRRNACWIVHTLVPIVCRNLAELKRFPALESALVDAARRTISNLTVPLLEFVKMLIKREVAYINVDSDEFSNDALVFDAFDRTAPPPEGGKSAQKKPGGLFSGAY